MSYTDRHTDIQRDIDRQTDRQTESDKDRQTDSHYINCHDNIPSGFKKTFTDCMTFLFTQPTKHVNVNVKVRNIYRQQAVSQSVLRVSGCGS